MLRVTNVREARAAARREAWFSERRAMSDYLHSPQWYDKRDRAFVIWRCIGWLVTIGPLAARLWFTVYLHGLATFLLAAPVQAVCAVGFTYAVLVRGSAMVAHRPLKRVGHHVGYTHVDIRQGDMTFEHCTERWWEIWPVTQRVNRMESRLRRDRPSPGFGRYFRRTIIAIGLVRFWWVVGVTAGAMWYWSPVVVLGWVERTAGRL